MQKQLVVKLSAFLFISCCCSAQPQQVQFENFGNIASIAQPDQSKWQQLKADYVFSQTGLNSRITYNQNPVINANKSITLEGWRGEEVNAEAVVSTTKDISSLHATITDLISDGGQAIDSKNCEIGYVYYVIADNSRGVCYKKDNQTYKPVIVPDIIDFQSTSSFVKKNSNRPVWIKIKIPRETNPGNYNGKVTVTVNGSSQTLNIALKVSDKAIPVPANRKFFLELWQYPITEADYYKVKPWSDEHFRLMEPAMRNLKEAGEDVITASFFWDPFNPSARNADEMMMKPIKTRSGEWDYDFTNFDKWVNFMMSLGINKQITCFGMAPLNYKYYYFDEAKNQVEFFQQGINGAQYRQFWKSYLTAFEKHLKEKNWFNITTIGFSEKNPDVLVPLINLIKGVDKDWKISFSGKYFAQIQDDVYDYSLISNQQIPDSTIDRRRSKGFITTFYTSCWERFPNTFVVSDPVDATWLSWNAANRNMDGYLRYAYDYWTPNVLSDVRSNLASGDRFLIYPYGKSSIRFEMFKDGIEDYEKINSQFGNINADGNAPNLQREESSQFKSILSGFDFKKVSAQRSRYQQIQQGRKLLE